MNQCTRCGKTNPADIHTCTPPTDKELLELAAKAAGWKSWEWIDGFLSVYDDEDRYDIFMPLTDDGDALRLAVKLGLSGGFVTMFVRIEAADDPYAAIRREIVRGAAEIGRGMK